MEYQKVIYTSNQLSAAHNAFEKDGVVFFNELLPRDIFLEATLKMEAMIKLSADTEKLVNLHFLDSWLANFISRSEFTDVASALLGVKNVKIFSSFLINKPANGLMTVPWHQDAAYDWPLYPLDCASLRLAIDDLTSDNGVMRVALGAHKNGPLEMIETNKLGENDKLFSNVLQRSIPESVLNNYEKVDLTMNKGFCSFHHSLLPHLSAPNLSNRRRCVFIVRYCRGDAILKKYPGMPREDYFKDFELFDPIK